jgi:hypothetical protein
MCICSIYFHFYFYAEKILKYDKITVFKGLEVKPALHCISQGHCLSQLNTIPDFSFQYVAVVNPRLNVTLGLASRGDVKSGVDCIQIMPRYFISFSVYS